MKTIYQAVKNEDLIEGRGKYVTIGYFENESDAVEAQKGFTFMGGKPAGKTIPVDVFESFAEFEGFGNEKLKQQALSKLTTAEKNALGI